MPRSIWNGALSFGLVNVPVQLFSATQQKDVRFHQFQAGTGQRIRDRRVAEESGEEVAYEDIVKGYEIDPIHFEKTYYLAPRPETGAERATPCCGRRWSGPTRCPWAASSCGPSSPSEPSGRGPHAAQTKAS